MILEDIITFIFFLLVVSCTFGLRLDVKRLKEREAVKSRSLDQCGCGYSQYGKSSCDSLSRIIGGKVARPFEMPWSALVAVKQQEDLYSICGGVLINRWFVLTAAHCVQRDGVTAKPSKVQLGTFLFFVKTNNSFVTKAMEVIPHHQYNASIVSNDIALIKLRSRPKISMAIQTICLPSNLEEKYEERIAFVSGWGKTNTSVNNTVSNILRKAALTVLKNSHKYCKSATLKSTRSSKICGYGWDRDSCYGDSGGPLILNENGRCTLIGLVSYGFGCAKKFLPGVYTRITSYMEWIRHHAQRGGCMDDEAPFKCDLTCTNVLLYSGIAVIVGVRSSCYKGVCYALNPSVDLCRHVKDPCQQGLHCPYAFQCQLREVLYGVYNNPTYKRVIQTEISGIKMECNTRTGNCCDLDNPGNNLCQTLRDKDYENENTKPKPNNQFQGIIYTPSIFLILFLTIE
ncbi:unnamed protein product [Lepeophtheirus salmonis]|uniref:(salmon louse) hypothetical protein n=1 Tax=Lepeophtheirus salmonis TaxID=72036 RepID=A0A7R8CC47_LEPSM|nr:unnamed protein product [Lepeophtheirus salmonis]CAF2767223.1 unnamed protein product [Lepeophtheirus salmonis]